LAGSGRSPDVVKAASPGWWLNMAIKARISRMLPSKSLVCTRQGDSGNGGASTANVGTGR
jgi:hypothetical protein